MSLLTFYIHIDIVVCCSSGGPCAGSGGPHIGLHVLVELVLVEVVDDGERGGARPGAGVVEGRGQVGALRLVQDVVILVCTGRKSADVNFML